MALPSIPLDLPVLLSHPPWKPVSGICNFRDLGGYPIVGSTGSVKRNIVFRCAEPNYVREEGMHMLTSKLGITSSYDLRSRREVEQVEAASPTPEIPGVVKNFVPVFEDRDMNPEVLAIRYNSYTSGDLASAYRSILHAAGPLAYRAIFTHLLTRPADPLLVHCTAGKDRTGVVCALILALAGVEDSIVAEEYALTAVGLVPFMDRIKERLEGMPMFSKGDESAKVGMSNLLSSTVETMKTTLAIVREEFGGVEAYLQRQCGFTAEEVQTIKRNVTSEDPPCFRLDTDGKIALVGDQ